MSACTFAAWEHDLIYPAGDLIDVRHTCSCCLLCFSQTGCLLKFMFLPIRCIFLAPHIEFAVALFFFSYLFPQVIYRD